MSRSSHRLPSAHMADLKGKGICYESDDEPIQLTDQNDSHTIRDFQCSLIGKVLNPKKQNVVKLLQHMLTEWKLQDRIIANDLGNGKFLFNFETEEDLQYVLQQGPFHYNFCMFVLVRWEPIVHDDYPWIIPFWVGITGIPLHLWTSKNLKKIGSKLGHVGEDKIKESEGRMCIDVDTRKPLIFSKKILSPGGDEVTIQIKYELRFKHCTFCGMLSHELSHCTKKEQGSSNQMERAYVFSRVQLPIGASARQPLLREQKPHDRYNRYEHRESKYHHNVDVHSSKRILEVNGYRRTAYARHDDSSDWPKERVETQSEIVESIREPYALMALQLQIGASSSMPREIPAEIEPHNISGQRTASLIITPSRHLTEQDDNVTKRIKTIPRSIMFSRTEELHPHNAQMIDALSEMEIVIENKNDDGKEELMECDGDDLLGQDLMELEEGASNLIPVADTDATGVLKKERARGSSSTRGVGRSGIPLSLPIKKAEFLRRGSPKHRSSTSKGSDRSAHHRHSSKASKASSHKANGLEGSKKTSIHHP
ncbi:hypothetical protein Bca4012_073693 [Brassica carinata]